MLNYVGLPSKQAV